MDFDKQNYLCYIIKSTLSPRAYVGSTNDFPHRIRQHNGDLTGGAKRTHYGRPFTPICIITGFENQKEALKSEWRVAHPNCHRKKKYDINNNISGLNLIFGDGCRPKMTSTSERNISDMNLTVNINKDYAYLLKFNKPNITIVTHDTLDSFMIKPKKEPKAKSKKVQLEEPVEGLIEGLIDEPIKKPKRKPKKERLEEPKEGLIDEPIKKPNKEQLEEPKEGLIDEPIKKPKRKPNKEQLEEPKEGLVEGLINEPIKKPKRKPKKEIKEDSKVII
jgi:predicted GIY-YIG superfamily endonuclease